LRGSDGRSLGDETIDCSCFLKVAIGKLAGVLHIEYAACELTADGLHLAVA